MMEDLTERRGVFDWMWYLQTDWAAHYKNIVGGGICQALMCHNPHVADPNRPDQLRVELILCRTDGSRVRLYHSATEPIFESPGRAAAFPLLGPANPRAVTWTYDELKLTPQVYVMGRKDACALLEKADALLGQAQFPPGSHGASMHVVWDLTDGSAWQWWRWLRSLVDQACYRPLWSFAATRVKAFAVIGFSPSWMLAARKPHHQGQWEASFGVIMEDGAGYNAPKRVVFIMRASRGWQVKEVRGDFIYPLRILAATADEPAPTRLVIHEEGAVRQQWLEAYNAAALPPLEGGVGEQRLGEPLMPPQPHPPQHHMVPPVPYQDQLQLHGESQVQVPCWPPALQAKPPPAHPPEATAQRLQKPPAPMPPQYNLPNTAPACYAAQPTRGWEPPAKRPPPHPPGPAANLPAPKPKLPLDYQSAPPAAGASSSSAAGQEPSFMEPWVQERFNKCLQQVASVQQELQRLGHEVMQQKMHEELQKRATCEPADAAQLTRGVQPDQPCQPERPQNDDHDYEHQLQQDWQQPQPPQHAQQHQPQQDWQQPQPPQHLQQRQLQQPQQVHQRQQQQEDWWQSQHTGQQPQQERQPPQSPQHAQQQLQHQPQQPQHVQQRQQQQEDWWQSQHTGQQPQQEWQPPQSPQHAQQQRSTWDSSDWSMVPGQQDQRAQQAQQPQLVQQWQQQPAPTWQRRQELGQKMEEFFPRD